MEKASSEKLKGSRHPECKGVRNVSICPNLSRTAAMEVLFSINFAVVFDFMYFRFRPSKAKSIGNVLTNRQNAAKRVQKSVEELRMGIPALRKYIDATMPLGPIGNGVQICSVYNFQILFRGFFFCSPRIA
jgi:hypothetical protein